MLTLLIVILGASSPTATLDHVQRVYRAGGDLQAEFSHAYVDKLRGKRQEETGKLWAKPDGRVRWTYLSPTRKDFVYDGEQAHFYEPENAQVTIFEAFEQHPLWNALRFLWGQGDVRETFDVTACREKCVVSDSALEVLELTPKQPMAQVSRALLVVDPGSGRVQQTIVFDAIGNRSEYRFSQVVLGQPVDPAKFEFPDPAKLGVSIVRAPR